MKLVKEIPEFLFGNSKATVEPAEAADSEAEMGSERAFADGKWVPYTGDSTSAGRKSVVLFYL